MVTYHTDGTAAPRIARRATTQWLTDTARRHGKTIGQLAYIYASPARMLEVNRQYLGHDFDTDVITFDYTEGDRLGGDIYICPATVADNARRFATTFDDELRRVTVHGLLHLCGLADKTAAERARMRQAEDEALARWDTRQETTDVLLIGSGAREHAIAWKLAQSPLLGHLYTAPGNPGTAQLGTNVDIAATDFPAIIDFIAKEHIGLVVCGPEQPLADGLADAVAADPRTAAVAFIGPTREGAQLEASKAFAKDFMQRHGIPTARHRTFRTGQADQASQYLATLQPPYVLKADGLCQGKGVVIAQTLGEAREALPSLLQRAGTVLIEDYTSGPELSAFALLDGRGHYVLLPEAKDYKRIGNGDQGPNTGGMGSISPVPWATKEFMHKVEEHIVKPTVNGLLKDGVTYTGFIFFGLACQPSEEGAQPSVIEYNARLGDPETETILQRLDEDLMALLLDAASGNLRTHTARTTPSAAACVMLVSGGYPGPYESGRTISGITGLLKASPDAIIFHAGTALGRAGRLITAGGRVIAVSRRAKTAAAAAAAATADAAHIKFKGKFNRTDIGKDAL
ncbi:MAG: phosphoribosylamine--glycine ligase [Bacteroidaceae bacterium]|nr:phosphoribosylamine--glycine ligase [Bacteroidaceae bacterium]